MLIKRVDDQWLVGRVGDKEGMFPENFVDIIHPLNDEVLHKKKNLFSSKMTIFK